MFKRHNLITSIMICSTIFCATSALAKPEHGAHHRMGKVFSQLELTETQKQDIKQIYQQARDDMQVSKPDMKSAREELNALVEATTWDQEAVEALLASHQAQRGQADLLKAQNKHAVWKILTTEQQSEFEAMIAEKKSEENEGQAKSKHNRKGKDHKWGKFYKKLGLSDEQKASMKTIKEQAKTNGQDLYEKIKSFKQAEKALIHQAEFDTTAWQTLYDQHQADFLALAVLKEHTRHLKWNLLTPEQQTKMQRIMRKKMGGKYHKGDKKGRPHKQS